MSFLTGTQVELLYVMPAPITKNTYTTEAAFTGVAGTNTICKIPAGYFANDNPNPVGRCLYLQGWGVIANTAAATFAVNLGLDTTAGTKANSTAVMAATAPVAAVTAPLHFEAWYTCTAFATSTMTLQVNGAWASSGGASGAAAVASGIVSQFRGSLTGLSTTADLFIELFGTWSASSASNTTTIDQMMLWGLN
jgi:hypothetical protein